ncbi:MAG: copper transport protein [Solirubrobacteraceae bacterium]|nr:copper transport protein [Solirubrobacteraceae bacterium]
MSARARLGLAAAATAIAVAALAPAAAQAHATLEGTSPARGADVKAAPRAVTFRFDEPVEGNFGAVRVYDARGRRVDDNKVVHPGGRGPEVSVGLDPGLRDGTYTATYRVISADSHPVSGGVVFSVGNPGTGPAATVSDLLSGSSAGPVTDVAFGVTRGLDYLAIALMLGGLAFLLLSWRPALVATAGAGGGWPEASTAFAARAQRLLTVAVVLGVVSGAAGIVLQGATAGGTSFWSALDPGVVREVLGTRFGRIWGLRVVDWLLLGTALAAGVGARTIPVLRPAAVGADGVAPAPFPRAGVLAALAVPAAVLALTPALAGHATTQHPVAALLPLDVVHVLAMSVWIGGLVALLLVVPAATRKLEAPERSRLLAAVLLRFSPIALGCVVALAATGTAQALIDMGGLSPLTTTAFGRAVLIKVALLLALVAVGAVNRQRVVPALKGLAAGGEPPGAAGRVLRRTLRGEVALVIVVLGVTSALVSYAPPVATGSGPVSKTTTMGPIELQATIDPARVGANQMHVYLFDRKTGAAYTKTKELGVDAALPGKGIGPLKVLMHQAGPGHYVADAFQLIPGGTWQLTVTDRVSDFDEYTAKIAVPVR